jgi:hypothetical protein
MSPKKQHTVIAGNRAVATAAYLILTGNAPGFRNSQEIDAQRPRAPTGRTTQNA